MIVSLVGYRGTGKSLLAGMLAQRLHMKAVDSDRVIEERAGCTIAEIFARSGEAEFRRLEAEAIAELCGHEGLIIATGGGAILNADTRKRLQQAGPVVWLTAEVSEIARRMQSDETTAGSRPALTDLSFEEEIRSLLEKREPLYRDVSDFEVETTNRDPESLVDEILSRINDMAAKDGSQ